MSANYSRRHYEQIADIFNNEIYRNIENQEPSGEHAILGVLAEFIIMFQADNPLFDKDRFTKRATQPKTK